MTRYVNVDELLEKLPNDLPYKASVKRVLMQAPAVDVVSKNEVVNEIFEDIGMLFHKYHVDPNYTWDKMENDIIELRRKVGSNNDAN